MLSSITPLGQRGRGMSWNRTVVAFWIGAISAGVLVFSLAGFVGPMVNLDALNPWLATSVVAGAGVLDLLRVKPPGPKRQVDEDWLGRYRDWVVGLGYGAQLGSGLATIIPTWGIWVLLLVSASVGLPGAAIIGASFGVGRSLLLLANRSVTSPGALSETMRRFAGAESAAKHAAIGAYALAIIMVGLNVV